MSKNYFYGYTFVCCTYFKIIISKWLPDFYCIYSTSTEIKRGQKINKSPVQGISETLNLDFRCPKTLKNNTEEYQFLKALNADIAIVVAYGQIIPKNFLTLTKKVL